MQEHGSDPAPAEAQGYFARPPALQVIVLGSGGGPSEDNVTGLLVRSTATQWTKGSVLAVDAGTHLAAIIKILEEHLPRATLKDSSDTLRTITETPKRAAASLLGIGAASPAVSPYTSLSGGYFTALEPRATRVASPLPRPDSSKLWRVLTTGPFTNLELPYESARANAAYVLRSIISTYLITHPHLDHLSGFAVNTASFQHTSRPKTIAALPSTIDAIKTHIFNNVIWPNLSDEEGGVGLVSYMRLAEGGNVALGEGDGKGYIEVCEGLGVKSWKVSHGHCMKKHSHRGSSALSGPEPGFQQSPLGTRLTESTSTALGRRSHTLANGHAADNACVYDSSAFFIRCDVTGSEVLIFGDVEPDSLSLSPRTARVWADAAPKIASGLLRGVVIECSYDDSQSDDTLFGHLAPRHLIAELQVLAGLVHALGRSDAPLSPRKRRRPSPAFGLRAGSEVRTRRARPSQRRRGRQSSASPSTARPSEGEAAPPVPSVNVDRSSAPSDEPVREASEAVWESVSAASSSVASRATAAPPALQGLQVVIIHMKDTLKDGPHVGERILAQLLEYEKEAQLGCTFVISRSGTSIWL
ncbi:MAG: 3,5-cyclic-AMP phosphodiesterase [Lasallia pustulata]|uniref:3,5-cyclic-AMP phosphodiesterase n=1 Tax=Lasallia pustulata TaxID=136370 RepID=A0A5M8PU30_9LECA|nr:MAG: 3,5-cyclic-AMP phosphodiesterase [Lasallia pustulata]